MFPPPSFYAHRARNLVEAANPKDHLIPTSTYNTPDISIRLDRVARSITITQGEEQLLHYDFRSRQATTHSEDLGALLESAERHLRTRTSAR